MLISYCLPGTVKASFRSSLTMIFGGYFANNCTIKSNLFLNSGEIESGLLHISALELADCQEWSRNYGVCYGYVEAHDGSRGRNQTISEPDALNNNVTSLSSWVSSLKEKHKVS